MTPPLDPTIPDMLPPALRLIITVIAALILLAYGGALLMSSSAAKMGTKVRLPAWSVLTASLLGSVAAGWMSVASRAEHRNLIAQIMVASFACIYIARPRLQNAVLRRRLYLPVGFYLVIGAVLLLAA